jgi:8-oxo-dGTP pyrophosphatase MutT (NUDIX family)
VAALIHDAPQPRVLLMKRAERQGDPWSGHISLPGGGYHAHEDESLLDTAIRETREELGFQLTRDQALGNLTALGPRNAGPMPIEVTPFIFRTEVLPEIVVGPEALSAFWLPLDLALLGSLDKPFLYPQLADDVPELGLRGSRDLGPDPANPRRSDRGGRMTLVRASA